MAGIAGIQIVALVCALACLPGCASIDVVTQHGASSETGPGDAASDPPGGECIQPDLASRNAPLADGLRGTPLEVARNFAAALEDPLVQDEPVDVGRYKPAFKTQQGYILMRDNNRPQYEADDDGRFTIEYARGVLDRLGADGDAYHVWWEEDGDAALYQAVDGDRLFGTGFDWSTNDDQVSLGIEGAYELPASVPSLSGDEKRQIAEQAAACLMLAAGHTPDAGYAHQGTTQWGRMVINETIVEYMLVIYSAPPNDDHCPESGFSIMVDPVARRAIGSGGLPCA